MNKNVLLITAAAISAITVASAVLFHGRQDYADSEYTWYASYNDRDAPKLVRGSKIDAIKNDINALIHALNKSAADPETFRTPDDKEPNDPPKLKLIAIKGPVVNVEVINDEYLTQRMGSTGANEFLAVATFTLTEYAGIKSVKFTFLAGDHAEPGTYAREDFLRNWKLAR